MHCLLEGYNSDNGCGRDVAKEEWAIARSLCVMRVLREDVWNDRYDWQGWLSRSIETARSCEPPTSRLTSRRVCCLACVH